MTVSENAFLHDLQHLLHRVERCLTQWLAGQKLKMSPPCRRQAAALVARYFYEEEGLSDRIIFNFLNRISGHPAIDPDNMGDVENAVRRLIARAQKQAEKPPMRFFMVAMGLIVFLLLAMAAEIFSFSPAFLSPLTSTQQAELKALVDEIVRLEREINNRDISHHAVWAEVKKPVLVRRYEDIPQSAFTARKAFLLKRRAEIILVRR